MDADLDTHKSSPEFLIAPPSLADPNFKEAVVLICVNESEGAMGFILNRPSGLKLHEILKDLEIDPVIGDREVLAGGPVSNYAGFVMYEHPEDAPLAPGIEITKSISITPSLEVLQKAALNEMPGRFELLLGYAGWGPGQLDNEMNRGGWLHCDFESELLFNVPVEKRWEEIFARLGVSPLAFINVPGGAQA
jgi:putative transcriptional regulator